MPAQKTKTLQNKQPHDARLSALMALVHTLDKGKSLDSAWESDRHFSFMNPPDRAFTQLLVKTTIRHLGQIDEMIDKFIEQPINKKIIKIKHIIRLGIAQLIWLETPPHAAVHSTVELTKKIKMAGLSGLVNAVLKRMVKDGKEVIDSQDAEKINTPKWLWESWEKFYGTDKTRKIVQMHTAEPPLDITVKNDPNFWAERLDGKVVSENSVRLSSSKNITNLQGFSEGKWWVQDIAASIPAKLLIKNIKNLNQMNIIDMCAAPGGKTAQLINAGAKVTAIDKSKERVNTLKINLRRLKLKANCINADALKWQPDFTPDAILLDAPCSSTGTIRRHPDVAWHKKPEDITKMTIIQYSLINHALNMLKTGGLLVYSVCSLQKEEGEEQIEQILNKRDDIELIKIKADMVDGKKDWINEIGQIRTLPCYLQEEGGMDGFFISILVKK
ncbi:MAG: 16S rRNA (cytosine(967)-C(5))-methyltransferase RsmB [Rickettsiales bacterium]